MLKLEGLAKIRQLVITPNQHKNVAVDFQQTNKKNQTPQSIKNFSSKGRGPSFPQIRELERSK